MKQIKRYFLSLLFLVSFVFFTKAQIVPCFTTSAVKGCIPFTVTVDASCATVTGPVPFYNYNYILGGGAQTGGFSPATTHTYNVAGTYRIRQNISNPSNFYDIIVEAIDPPQPTFNLTSCAGGVVSAVITDASYDKYIVDFGDGSPTQTVSTGATVNHTYPAEGSKPITITGVYNPNSSCKSSTKSIYAINSVIKPDLVDLTVLQQKTANGSTQLRFNSVSGQKYRIEKRTTNTGSFAGAFTAIGSTLDGNNTVVTYTDVNLNTQTNEHQYRIVAFDDCATEQISDVICTVRINAIPNNAVNNITWNTLSPVTSYQFTKNGVPQSLTPSTATTFADNSITCGTQYCYKSIASLTTNTLAGAPHKSYSVDTCIVAVNIPATPPVEVNNVNSSMNGNTANITWNNPAGGISGTTLSQSVNGGSYSVLAKPSTNSFSYPIPNINSSYCFQVEYTDLCNNQSAKSKSTCPLLINGTITGTTVTLNWNSYSGFDGTGGQSYVVQKLNESGVVISETNVGTATTFSETVNFSDPYLNYRIKVVPANTTYPPVFSNNTIFTFEAQIFVPDIFTPNGDGTNELFEVKAKYIKTYSITIFSRWGEVVYASNSENEGWDGMDRNVRAIEGVYTYKIVATDIHDKEFIQTGTVTLTR